MGTTHSDYFQQLEQALADGWSEERIRKTFRWCAIEYHRVALDISESFDRKENEKATLPARVKNKLIRSIAPHHQQYSDCTNRVPQLSVSADINVIVRNQLDSVLDLRAQDSGTTVLDETKSLKNEVNRLVEELYGLDTNFAENSLAKKLQNFAQS